MKYFYSIVKVIFVVCVLQSVLLQSIIAQNLNSSPYTRYGLGQIEEPITTSFFGNGLTTAEGNFYSLNILNPASYATLLKYNPVFNVDINGNLSTFHTSSSKSTNHVVGLKTFALGLPVGKKFGFAFGLTPYSTMGYNITSSATQFGENVNFNYSGDGSINNSFLGFGYNIINKGDTSKLSLGINAHYLSGTLKRERSVLFESTSYKNSKVYESEQLSGLSFDAGLLYEQKINDNSSFKYGATFSFGSKLNVKQDFYAYNFNYVFSTIESPQDTLTYYEGKPGYYMLPKKFSSGISYRFAKKWTIGAQYTFENWQYLTKTIDSTGVDLSEISQKTKYTIGLTYEPTTEKGDKNKNILQKSTYRLGIYTGNYGLSLDSTELKNSGISFGISLPMISSSSLSSLNFGFAYGKMGTTQNGLIQENYFTFRIGLSLMPNMRFDRWFMKRKYD